MIDKIARHKEICDGLNALYAKKNHDYGDSFHLSFLEEGMAMPRIRLGDKLNRFKALSKDPDSQKVQSESMRDTLLDLANYAIMTILEMEDKGDSNEKYVKLLRLHGHTLELTRRDGGFEVNDPLATICQVCRYADCSIRQEPCKECLHSHGEVERFELDPKVEEVEE